MYSAASSRARVSTANGNTGSRGAGGSTLGGSSRRLPKQAPQGAQGKAAQGGGKGSSSTSISTSTNTTSSTGGPTAGANPTNREGAKGREKASTTATPTTSSTGRATNTEPCFPPSAAQPAPAYWVPPPKRAPLPQPSPAATAAASAPAPKRRSSKASTVAQKAFEAEREELARTLYNSWNLAVFGGRLPPDLPLVWNPRLVATAGQVLDDGSLNSMKTAKDQRIPCRLELSNRLLSTLPRLRSTLAHEMCHVAAWAIEGDYTTPHGRAFWKWANALMAHDARSIAAASAQPPAPTSAHTPSTLSSTSTTTAAAAATVGAAQKGSQCAAMAGNGMGMGWSSAAGLAAGAGIAGIDAAGTEKDREEGVEGEDGRLIITRLHSFKTHMPHRWQCSNAGCGKVYTRHRNSIDVQRHVCAQCRGRLQYLGRFSKNDQLLAPRGDKQPSTPGQPTSGTTATKGKAPATPNAYALFVKEHMSTIKSAHPKGTPMNVIMKAVGSKWTEHKARQQQQQQPAGSKQPDLPTPSPHKKGAGAYDPGLPLPRRLSSELGRLGTAVKSSPTASDAAASAGQSDACSAASDACEVDMVLIRDQE